MALKYYFNIILFYLYYQFENGNTESITFISTERPVVSWFETNYFKNFTIVSRRVSRQDPRHYVQVYAHTLFPVGNDVLVDFYFYQFLTNRYRPSFVEMHFRFCDMVRSDLFFGTAMKQALEGISCPYPPGEHVLRNMTISYVPKGFPFAKGRIYCNASIEQGGVSKPVVRAHIDMEIKVSTIKQNTKN